MVKQIHYGPLDRRESGSAVNENRNTLDAKLKFIRRIICLYITILLLSCHKHDDNIPPPPPPPPAPQFNSVYSGYVATSIARSHEGGYVIAGFTSNNEGNTNTTHGSIDAWVLKIDKEGTKLWQRTIGGSSYDAANFITTTLDGGYVMAGFSYSNDGDVSGNHGIGDAWVVKLDEQGKIIWQKSLGGYGGDAAHSVVATRDSGYVIACETSSLTGDVSGNHGLLDGWVVKLDKDGNILWQKALGGSDWDAFNSIAGSPDGGYLAAGYTRSVDGDVSGYHGVEDGWVAKLDKDGTLLWQKTLGGVNADEINSTIATPDGGYVMAGVTKSNEGDVSGNHGEGDAWIVNLDKDGNILWQKTLGGSGWETANAAASTRDGSYVIAAWARSSDGDVFGFHGGAYDDAWIVKLDKQGNKLWQKALGGSAQDDAKSIVTTVDGNYVIAGNTNSNDGDIIGTHGGMDAWVLTLKDQ